METKADRLKQARKDAGYSSVRAACAAFGYHYPTYAGHENGARDFDFESAERYAKTYKVDVTWLMSGKALRPTEQAEVIRIWAHIPKRDRELALRMLKGLTVKGK